MAIQENEVFESDEVRELVGKFHKAADGLRDQVGKVIIGQKDIVDQGRQRRVVGSSCAVAVVFQIAGRLAVRRHQGVAVLEHVAGQPTGWRFAEVVGDQILAGRDRNRRDHVVDAIVATVRAGTLVAVEVLVRLLLFDRVDAWGQIVEVVASTRIRTGGGLNIPVRV